MNTPAMSDTSWRDGMSSVRVTLRAIKAVCFGGCVVLRAGETARGPLVLLTVGTGLSLAAGLAGTMAASRKQSSRR
jgi:hypothetical protein